MPFVKEKSDTNVPKKRVLMKELPGLQEPQKGRNGTAQSPELTGKNPTPGMEGGKKEGGNLVNPIPSPKGIRPNLPLEWLEFLPFPQPYRPLRGNNE